MVHGTKVTAIFAGVHIGRLFSGTSIGPAEARQQAKRRRSEKAESLARRCSWKVNSEKTPREWNGKMLGSLEKGFLLRVNRWTDGGQDR